MFSHHRLLVLSCSAGPGRVPARDRYDGSGERCAAPTSRAGARRLRSCRRASTSAMRKRRSRITTPA